MPKKRKQPVTWGSSANMWRDPKTITGKGSGCCLEALAVVAGATGAVVAGVAHLIG